MEKQFEYEVAFSFCSQDEGLATSLDDLLKDRFKTFLYHRKQEVLAGTDGEKTFNEVFMQKARIAVILYRPEWGETPFTRIEQTAIRKRAYEHGYDFTAWIAMEEGIKLPEYVEPTRLYYGLPKFGIDGAAGVIEAAIQRAGGNTRPETLEERAARLNRQNIAQQLRIEFLSSQEGINAAGAAARQLIEAVEKRAQQLTDWQLRTQTFLEVGKIDIYVEVIAERHVLAVTWHQPYRNNLDEAGLHVGVWKGLPPRPGRHYFRGDEPPQERGEKFAFDRTLDGSDVWRKSNSEHVTPAGMVDYSLSMLLDAIHQAKMKEKPR